MYSGPPLRIGLPFIRTAARICSSFFSLSILAASTDQSESGTSNMKGTVRNA